MPSPLENLPDFSLVSESVGFEPTYYPERVNPKRKRNIKREDSLCEGQDIIDNGGKNVDLHVEGYLIGSEKSTFWDILANGAEYRLISMPWSGFVKIKNGNLEGPIGIDDREREFVYDYTLKLVSTASREDKELTIVDAAETVPDPAKNITFTQIYSEAGYTPPRQADIDFIKSSVNHAFEIKNWKLNSIKDKFEGTRTADVNRLINAAEDLTKQARSKVASDKGIQGVREAEQTAEIS
jgi:hypothetical protein